MANTGHRKRIASGVAAHLYSQAITIFTQLVSLPFFLHRWSPAQYGQWLLLSAVPMYLTVADAGILTAAGNSMSMAKARGDNQELQRIFQCSLAIVSIFVPVLAVITGLVLASFTFSLTADERVALAMLALAALLTVACGLFDAAYRPFGMYPKVTFYLTTARIFEWVGTLLGLYGIGTLTGAALGYLLGRLASCVIMSIVVRRDIPQLRWSFEAADRSAISGLFREGFGFLSFPVGALFNIQGMVLIVGSLLGPAAVTQFSTSRTLTRALAQLSFLAGKSLAPEVSALHGAGKQRDAARLSAQVFAIVMPLAVIGGLLLSAVGPSVIAHWGQHKIAFDRAAFSWLLAAALASAYWQIQSTLFTATNRHGLLAALYIAISVAGLGVAAATAKALGPSSASIGTFVVDFAMSVATFVIIRREAMGLSVAKTTA